MYLFKQNSEESGVHYLSILHERDKSLWAKHQTGKVSLKYCLVVISYQFDLVYSSLTHIFLDMQCYLATWHNSMRIRL